MTSNKRETKRFDCAVPVDGSKEGIFSDLKTVNFSKEGVGIISKKRLPLDYEVKIEIDLGEMDDSTFVTGVVKWVEPMPDGNYRIGLYFKDKVVDTKTRIDSYFSK